MTEPERPQQQRLEAEFPEARVSSINKGGAKLTYVPVGEVINRLNEVLGACWSWETVRVWRDDHDPDWVLAVGKMTATVDGVTSVKAGEGGVKVKKMRTGELVDLGDEFKGAASDALKKAAQKFGVGLYLSRTAQARAYETPEGTRDPVDEGWDSPEQAKELVDAFSARVKAAGVDVVQVMRHLREREGVIWPPTRDEYDMLLAEFQRVTSGTGLAHQEPQAAPADVPAPDAADKSVRTAQAEQHVAAMQQIDVLGNLNDYGIVPVRDKAGQRRQLAQAFCDDETWGPVGKVEAQ